jgi:hypothetical protein
MYDIFPRYNQQDVTFLNLFISVILYMVRVEPPPIIRISDCTYSFWYLSNFAATCCDNGWDGEAVYTVRAPDDGWRFHLKHVECEWNK